MTDDRPSETWTRRALVAAAVLLAVGLWMILDALGVSPPAVAGHWPLFVLLGGLASIVDYVAISRRPAALGLGVFGLVLGVVLYLLVRDAVGWTQVRLWVPGIFAAIGLGCLATAAVAKGRSPRPLVFGIVFNALAITIWGWREIPLTLFWGLVLLALGGAIAWNVAQHRSR